MKKLYSTILVTFLFLFSFTPLFWFPGNSVLLGYDNVYPLHAKAFLWDRIFSWTSTQGFSMDQSGIQGSLIIHVIDSIPQLLGFSVQTSQKIVYCFWFFLLLFAPYFLVIRLEKSGIIKSSYLRYFFPLLYAFNFYVLQAWWIAERTKFSLLVAAPLILSIVFPMFSSNQSIRKIVRNALICSLILTFFNGGGWVGLPLYGGLLIILFVYFLFQIFFYGYNRKKKNIAQVLLFFVLFSFSYVLLNAYTLLPFFSTTLKDYGAVVQGEGGISGIISWTQYLSVHSSFINLFRLQGIPDWYTDDQSHPYSFDYLNNPFLVLLSFMFPFLVFLSFLFKKKENKKIVLFLLFLTIVSMFLTAGIRRPFGFIIQFFMEHIPGFIIFRSTIFKFGYAYWFGVSFLAGLALSEIVERLFLKKIPLMQKRLAQILPPLFIMAMIVLYHYPYFTVDIFKITKQPFKSRVSIPSYVYEFSDWWRTNGKTEKILLLPRLNENWGFEQYSWGYLSLYPLLGNFANRNIIEDAAVATRTEKSVIENLYKAISEKDFQATDIMTSMLGIKYFLVRRDFSSTVLDQETEDPFVVESSLKQNPKIQLVKQFDQWVLFEYSEQKPSIFVKNAAISVSGDADEKVFKTIQNPLLLDSSIYQEHPEIISQHSIFLECLSCKGELLDISPVIPKPNILLDSALYDLVHSFDKLNQRKNVPYDDQIRNNLGQMVKTAGQVSEMITQDTSEYYINLGVAKYTNQINDLANDLKNMSSKSSNSYLLSMTVQQYLNAQSKYILEDIRKKSTFITMEKILYLLNNLSNNLEKFYGAHDFNIKKYYKFTSAANGDYTIRVNKESLGFLSDEDMAKIVINIDGKKSFFGTSSDKENIYFGKINIQEGDHAILLELPDQKNLFSEAKIQEVSGNTCFSSFLTKFSYDEPYSLTFTERNNFDPNFFFFVDDGKSFSPRLSAYFPLSGVLSKSYRYVISPKALSLPPSARTIRISFCAPSLNDSYYRDSIKELSLVRLTNPQVDLFKEESNHFGSPPVIFDKEVNQTHHVIQVKNSRGPFLLVFTDRYSHNWNASVGEHMIGNKIENVWYIDKTGNFVIDITYNPQKFFIAGSIVSLFALISFAVYVFLTRKQYENKT